MGDLAFLDSMDSGFSLRTFRLGKYTSFLSYIQQNDASLQHHQKKNQNKGSTSGFLGGSWRKEVGYHKTITKIRLCRDLLTFSIGACMVHCWTTLLQDSIFNPIVS
jgi:hypothetical protein